MSLIPNDNEKDSFWDVGIPTMFHHPGFPMHAGFPTMHNQLANLQQGHLGMDLTEEQDKWVVHADLPGFKDEDIEISIKNGKLAVCGKRERNFESDTGVSHRVERSFGEVRRVVQLPRGADQDNAQAHLEHGVLTVNFPKLAVEEGGKKIPIIKK